MSIDSPALAREDARRRIARIQGFEAPFFLSPDARDAYVRRFSTLFIDEGSERQGGNAQVMRVLNAWGEPFALKALTRTDEGSRGAFDREYELHRGLSGLKGFPLLYGKGTLEGMPAIVMEWIEGVPLSHARRQLAVDEAGRLSPLTAARIGRDLFDLLSRMSLLEGEYAHRDLSPENVLVRTARRPLQDQVQEGVFDLCLVDFGSAARSGGAGDGMPGEAGRAVGAVGAYAAPELLPDAPERVRRHDKAPAVDVFAAASMLYELACGRLPFEQDGAKGGGNAWRVKAAGEYREMRMAHRAAEDIVGVLSFEPEVAVVVGIAVADFSLSPDAGEVREALALVDLQLEELIGAGLAVPAGDRPTAAAMRDALSTFCFQYADNVGRALRGERLVDCLSGSPASGFGGSPARLRNLFRTVGKSASAAVWGVAVAATGVLAHGTQATLALGPVAWEGSLGGAAVSLALALPAFLGFTIRAKGAHTLAGFVRGSTALALCAGAMAVAGGGLSTASPGVVRGLAAALFASTAAAWCPMVVDFALAALPARRRKLLSAAARRHALEAGQEGLPEGEKATEDSAAGHALGTPSAGALPEASGKEGEPGEADAGACEAGASRKGSEEEGKS